MLSLRRVMEVLKEMEPDRKCYRLVGESTLVQYKVGDVLDILGGSLLNVSTWTTCFYLCCCPKVF